MRMSESEYTAYLQRQWLTYQRQRGLSLTEAPAMSEKVFMAAVIRLAKAHGWEVFHPYSMKRSPGEGYPDLTLVHPERHLCVWAELKVPGGVTTLAQQRWLEVLGQVTSVGATLWTPEDWDRIRATLEGQP
jgi:hypothetical protein